MLWLFTGCTDQKGSDNQDANLGNSVEIDDTDEDNSDDVTLPTASASRAIASGKGGSRELFGIRLREAAARSDAPYRRQTFFFKLS